jgi:hypothetical protein
MAARAAPEVAFNLATTLGGYMGPVTVELSPEAAEALYQISSLMNLPPERALPRALAITRVIGEEISRGSTILVKRSRDTAPRELDFGSDFGRASFA